MKMKDAMLKNLPNYTAVCKISMYLESIGNIQVEES